MELFALLLIDPVALAASFVTVDLGPARMAVELAAEWFLDVTA